MKCRKCGWPPTEEDRTCPNCGRVAQGQFGLGQASFPAALLRRLALTESNSGRFVVVLLGLSALPLTWGAVYVRQEETLLLIQSLSWNAFDLVMSSGLTVVLATILFLIGTLASIVEWRGFVEQLVGLVVLTFSLNNYMQSVLPESVVSDPAYMIYSSFGLGFYLAWLSMFVILASNVFGRRDSSARRGDLPPSENERLNPRYWRGSRR